MKNKPLMRALGGVAVTGILFLPACTTAPKVPPRTLSVSATPAAQVTLISKSLTRPVALGITPLKRESITVANSMLDPSLRKGGESKSTIIAIDQLAGVELSLAATRDPHLYAMPRTSVPPWLHDFDLGLPAMVRESPVMGIEFGGITTQDGPKTAYSIKIQDRQQPLPWQHDMREGSYLFQLVGHASGRVFSGLLELQSADDEFVRFAYVPVFQRITAEELEEIARNEREPRMYTTHVDGRNRLLATVWLGSRQSTTAINIGGGSPRNIEVLLDRNDATLLVDNRRTGSRFYVEEKQQHILEISIPQTKGDAITIYGLLRVPELAHKAAALTSFAIKLTNGDIVDILKNNKVIKKTGMYRAPEDPATEIEIYELTLGSRRPAGY